MLSAVSLLLIATASALSSAFTLVSTRILEDKRLLRPEEMSLMLRIVTSAGDAPATLAIDSMKLVCLSALNSAIDSGRDNEIVTTCVAAMIAAGHVGVEEGGGGDGAQSPPLGPVKPLLQMHACFEELAERAVWELFGHIVHPAEAAFPAYFPATQSVQTVEALAAAYLPALHSWHTSVVAPTVGEYFPAWHSSQAADPGATLY